MTVSQKDKQQVHDLISQHFQNPKDLKIVAQLAELGARNSDLYFFIADEVERLRPSAQRPPSQEEINRFLQFSPEDCPVELPARKLLPIEEDIRRKQKGRRFIKR